MLFSHLVQVNLDLYYILICRSFNVVSQVLEYLTPLVLTTKTKKGKGESELAQPEVSLALQIEKK